MGIKNYSRVLFAFLACVATGSAQNLLIDGSFESPSLTPGLSGYSVYYLNPGALGAWQTTESQFEIWANPSPTELAVDGTQHLELLDTASTATVFQSFATTNGQAYQFSFFHSPRPGFDNRMTASVNSTALVTFNELGSTFAQNAFAWQEYTALFTATGPTTTISFTDSALNPTAIGNGSHIDGVSVIAIPEPSTYAAILGAAMLGFVAIRRRKIT